MFEYLDEIDLGYELTEEELDKSFSFKSKYHATWELKQLEKNYLNQNFIMQIITKNEYLEKRQILQDEIKKRNKKLEDAITSAKASRD